MPTFSWTGRTAEGQNLSGNLDAPTREEATKRLAERQIVVITLDERVARGGEPADPDRQKPKEKPHPGRALTFAVVLVAAAVGVGVWAPVVVYDCERTPAGIVNCVVHERALGLIPLRDQSIRNVAKVDSESREAYRQVTSAGATGNSRYSRSVSVDESRLILTSANQTSIRPQSWISDGSFGSRNIDTRASIEAMILGVRTESVSNWQIPYIPMIVSGGLVFLAVVFAGFSMLMYSPGFNRWMDQRVAEARQHAEAERESRRR